VSSIKADGTSSRERRGAGHCVRLCAGAGLWLCVTGFGPCGEPSAAAPPVAAATPGRDDGVAVQPAAAVTVAPAPAAPAPAAPAPAAAVVAPKQTTPTTRSYMRGHFLDTARMREAIVMGKLAELHAAAAAVADDPWTPKLRQDYRPYIETMRAVARSAQTAESVVSGAAALGKLGDACASCHLKFGGPGSPIAPLPMAEGADPGMVEHALATERLWEGLILPSDISWLSGARVLQEAPKLDSDVSQVAAAARHLSDLAKTATAATATERSKVFGNILLTCNACHERLGIVVTKQEIPR